MFDTTKTVGGIGMVGAAGLGTAYFGAHGSEESVNLGLAGAGVAAATGIGFSLFGDKLAEKFISGGHSLANWIGDKSIKYGEKLGDDLLVKGGIIGDRIQDFAERAKAGEFNDKVQRVGRGTYNVAGRYANKFISIPEGKNLTDAKLSGLSKILIGGIAAASIVQGAANQAEAIAMGQASPFMEGPTPRLPSYADNAGATGDLVFALHKNKRAY
jgi:hypothetical protein